VRSTGEVVETTLVGIWREVPPKSTGSSAVDWVVRLEDGTRVTVGELMQQWGEEHLGTPDLDPE
jgi:hypothetical protein